MKGLFRQVVVSLSGFIMIYTNFFSGSNRGFEGNGPEAGGNTMYDMYPTSVSPAPFTFVIWLPIFLGVLLFIIYQARPSMRENDFLDRLALPLIAAYLFNAATPFTPIGYSVVAIIALLIALTWAFIIIHQEPKRDSLSEKIFIHIPITLFFGWISVAVLVNISQWLVSIDWAGFNLPDTVWATLLIGISTSIGLYVLRVSGTWTYVLVLIWAFWGIVAVDVFSIPILIASSLATVIIVWEIIRMRKQKVKASI